MLPTPLASVLLVADDATTNYTMPVLNGRAFLEACARRHASAVVLTTSLHRHNQRLAKRLPIADFIAKPLTRARMTGLLARHFG